MNNPTSYYVLLFFFLIFNNVLCEINAKADGANAKLYIVYLGHKPHDDHELITDSHHDILGQVVGSKEQAKKLMVYSYRYGFSGFAAKLTNSQAKQIGELPGVVHVMQNPLYKPHTSRSWDFLGLSKNDPNNLLNKTNQGDGIVIGVLDGGIWGDSEAFNDEGLGPIPSKWKGSCKSEGNFNATKHCNKKIIGARWYIKGLIEEYGLNKTTLDHEYDLSPLDYEGHGTHCAATAAGSYVNHNVEYYGLNIGTPRGGAPFARLAIYKVCWNEVNDCAGADVLAAIDDAIKDGVDVLSASFGPEYAMSAEVHVIKSALGIGAFHAVSHGIPVVAAGGNEGPEPGSIRNTSPWIITVAASNADRDIVTPLTLGNNKTILANGYFKAKKEHDFAPLYFAPGNITTIKEVMAIPNEVKGKVVVLFSYKKIDQIVHNAKVLKATGALAFIAAMPLSDRDKLGPHDEYNRTNGWAIPFFAIDFEQGSQIFNYVELCESNNQAPMIKLGQSVVREGQKVVLKVPNFSSRGPNPFAPEILKPDVAAPGANIIAASIPQIGQNGFELMSGTSMATPHIAGIAALLKAAHPHWSPAAIKSALVTTAWNEDTYPSEIYSEGEGDQIADPFDYGGGICNANGAMDPGLIYDMDKDDYLNYLCSLGYSNEKVYNATTLFSSTKNSTATGIICPKEVPSMLDLNLPSISIPNLKNSVTIKRTVTNVGDVNSLYKLVLKPPSKTVIKVSPQVLKFDSKTKKISFEVNITSAHHRSSKFNFGSLAWSDGKHFVRIPIAVRRQVDV